MAIKKSDTIEELIEDFTDREKSQIDLWEERIDTAIRAFYIPGAELKVQVTDFFDHFKGELHAELFRRYIKAGWRIRWQANVGLSGIINEWIVLS